MEPWPVLLDYMAKMGGDAVVQKTLGTMPSYRRDPGPGDWTMAWWTQPTGTKDRATSVCPALLYERLDELGIDFSILYSSLALILQAHPDDEVRRVACRALNTYLAESVDGLGDRIVAAAVIPTHTPEEAIAELEHVVGELGFKVASFNSIVPRPAGERGVHYDTLALDSPYDYDPLWQRCVDLGVAVTSHSTAQGLGFRSTSHYMYNHIGCFSESGQAFAKALFFGGVTNRFPTLNFGFLECGVSWGVQLLADLIDRWHKRGGSNIERLNPSKVEVDAWLELVERYGGSIFADPARREMMRNQADYAPFQVDDFGKAGIDEPGDIAKHFGRFFFGCEADDPTIAWGYAADVNPYGTTLQAMLGSDIGHWDVTDIDEVVHEAYELLEDDRLDADQFRSFSCDNAIRLHGQMNPRFFDGTPVEGYARALLDSEQAATV